MATTPIPGPFHCPQHSSARRLSCPIEKYGMALNKAPPLTTPITVYSPVFSDRADVFYKETPFPPAILDHFWA
jgi:hypothetical protein